MESLQEGFKKAERESETKRNLFNGWIEKCKKEIKPKQDTLETTTQDAPSTNAPLKVQQAPTIK